MSDERLPASDEPQEPASTRSTEKDPATGASDPTPPPAAESPDQPREYGGRKGLDPVRYGDWEKGGRCIDF